MALPAFRKAELEYLVSFSDAKAIAIAPEYRGFDHAALARELKARLPVLKSILSTAPADGCVSMHETGGSSRAIGSSAGDPFDVALFLLSGGTTGMPKLIPRTHADYLYNARESAAASGLTSESRILIALPAEHNFPLACPGLLGALLTGARTCLQSIDQGDLTSRHIIEREQITHLPCVPALAIALLDLPQSSRASARLAARHHGRRSTAPGANSTRSQARVSASRRAAGARDGRGTAVLHASRRARRSRVHDARPSAFAGRRDPDRQLRRNRRSRPARSANCGAAVRTRFAATSARPSAIAKRSPPTDSTAPATWCGSIRPGISSSKEESKT